MARIPDIDTQKRVADAAVILGRKGLEEITAAREASVRRVAQLLLELKQYVHILGLSAATERARCTELARVWGALGVQSDLGEGPSPTGLAEVVHEVESSGGELETLIRWIKPLVTKET